MYYPIKLKPKTKIAYVFLFFITCLKSSKKDYTRMPQNTIDQHSLISQKHAKQNVLINPQTIYLQP
jgi:hypothetical protein